MLNREQIYWLAKELSSTVDNNFISRMKEIPSLTSKDLFNGSINTDNLISLGPAQQFWRTVVMNNEVFDEVLAKHKVCYTNETMIN